MEVNDLPMTGKIDKRKEAKNKKTLPVGFLSTLEDQFK